MYIFDSANAIVIIRVTFRQSKRAAATRRKDGELLELFKKCVPYDGFLYMHCNEMTEDEYNIAHQRNLANTHTHTQTQILYS